MEWREKTDFANIISWQPPTNYDIKFAYQVSGYDPNGYPGLAFILWSGDVRY